MIGGTVSDKANVAIYAKEDSYLRELLKCGDERGLTVWYDKDAMLNEFKKQTFLQDDSDICNLWLLYLGLIWLLHLQWVL